MKVITIAKKRFGLNTLYLSFITIFIYGCAGPNESAEYPNAAEEWIDEENKIALDTSIFEGMETPAAPIPLDEYVVKLAVDEKIKTHETAELRIWIGADGFMVSSDDQTVQATTTIPASIGQYAKITPYAPGFEVDPTEPKCIRIHPSGSEVCFSLKPKEDGSFKVSANIELYEGVDCTGTPVPKTAATLTVFVEVDNKYLISGKMGEMATIVWDKFLTFWGAVVALLFAVLLFLIRAKITKKTGYEDQDND